MGHGTIEPRRGVGIKPGARAPGRFSWIAKSPEGPMQLVDKSEHRPSGAWILGNEPGSPGARAPGSTPPPLRAFNRESVIRATRPHQRSTDSGISLRVGQQAPSFRTPKGSLNPDSRAALYQASWAQMSPYTSSETGRGAQVPSSCRKVQYVFWSKAITAWMKSPPGEAPCQWATPGSK